MKIADADRLKKHFENVVDVKLFTVHNILTIIETFSIEIPEEPVTVRRRAWSKGEIEKLNKCLDDLFKEKPIGGTR